MGNTKDGTPATVKTGGDDRRWLGPL